MKLSTRAKQHQGRSGQHHRIRNGLWLSGLLIATWTVAPAQDSVNEDEWYDPTDWFDGNNFEYDDTYDYDPYDYTYSDGYDYGYDWNYWDDTSTAYDWNDYNNYDMWDNDGYTSSYWDRYEWNDTADDAVTEGTLYSYSLWVPDRDLQGQNTGTSGGSSGQQGGNPSSAGTQAGKQDMKSGQQGLSRLSGTIEGLKTVRLNRSSGATGAFTLARVKMEGGETSVINLGRQTQVQDAQVKKGDKIQAIGRRGSIQGQTVFVAQKLRVNGREIDANPAIRLKGDASGSRTAQAGNPGSAGQTSAAKQRMSESEEEISGKVASIDKLKEGSQSSGRTLVQLTLQNGRTETVDLGPGAAPDQIGLDEGDTITVRGRRDQIQGRSVIVAELVKINGNRMSGSKS